MTDAVAESKSTITSEEPFSKCSSKESSRTEEPIPSQSQTEANQVEQMVHTQAAVRIAADAKAAKPTDTSVSDVIENILTGGSFAADSSPKQKRPQQESKEHHVAVGDDEDRRPSTVSPCSKDEPFINHGFALWESSRNEWLQTNDGNKEELFAKELPVDDIINTLFATSLSNAKAPFPCNVPLAQMVDLLQDLWEAEGLDV